ncbi:putative cyclic nucleotide-gated ion channel 20, chloroplastic [Datura stramonium]|uniref:Cyclic nucleotide-gated ion channel 20, chloroplastic n=1 Tax=Datura stramonium TaxID=4076 RepID=A0ABS8SF95_DATST|nr:putative cyclic nucleotide-gated ion channel 20, chloroplastic [Datura stramonium]
MGKRSEFQDTDLEEVTNLFARFLRNPRVQGALRKAIGYWQTTARRIQVAWRYRKKRQSCRADSSSPQH